ncbi:MAG: hypothetical protein ACAI25_11250 [Planctomycetota bacterium]
MKKTATKREKGYLTFEDMKRLAKGTAKDAEELLTAVREHRHEQRQLQKGRRSRSTRA